jgi:tripartite-type tricarboxylate transporter receptor subunit TctC
MKRIATLAPARASWSLILRSAGLLLLGFVFALTTPAAWAQTPAPAPTTAWPSKAVTVIVPFAPGGGADTLMRALQPKLAALWGQAVVIENKPGASGHIGADMVARSAPDGHTLLMGSTAAISEKNVDKLAAVALVSAEAYVLVVHTGVPAKDVRELVAHAKANPGKLHFGSSGMGAASHLSGELFKARAGVNLVHVPYKGTGQALTDLLAGHIQLMFAPMQTVAAHLGGGKIRALAVTGTKALEALPGVPTVAAAGVADYQAQGWFGLLAPAAAPPALLVRINDDVNRVLALPDVRKDLISKGADPGSIGAPEFARFVRQEQQRWTQLIKDAGIVLE